MNTKGKFFTTYNLTKRANAKAEQLGITGLAKMVFVFIATSGDASFLTITKKFNGQDMMELAQSVLGLMNAKAIRQMYASDRYYTVAI